MSSAPNSPSSADPATPLTAVAKPSLAAAKPLSATVPAPPGAKVIGVALDPKLAAPPLAAVPSPKLGPAAVATLKPLSVRPQPRAVPPNNLRLIRPVVGLARIKPRHRMLVLSFVMVVLLPVLAASLYLWGKAVDQYASTVGFSVRREEAGSAMDLLGGLTGLSKSSSSDTDILYEFLRSQKLVSDMDAKLDLRDLWSKPQGDPIFTFNPSGSIEDLVDYWTKMVRTSYDSSTGLLEVRVLAFTPDDATRIAQSLFDESSQMINGLSTNAREDSIRYAREELTTSQDRLKAAREAITIFRTKNQIVDPSTDFQTQAGLVASLENKLAEAQIEIDLLGNMPAGDPRLVQATRRVEVIEERIAAERSKVGEDSRVPSGGKDYAALASDYERLAVDREFAERAYVAALASYDAAQAEGQRKSRYLAAHIAPTKAEVSRYPERLSILGILSLFLLLAWSIGTLVAYSLKDRR